MIHLNKNTELTVSNISLNRLACVKDPFMRGRILGLIEFREKMKSNPGDCCKKCSKIQEKYA
jgi:hypothetical protein